MKLIRRIRLFCRDYFSEFGIAWSLAQMRDCERNGGHRWAPPEQNGVIGYGHTCRRCGCFETVSLTCGTTATNTIHTITLS